MRRTSRSSTTGAVEGEAQPGVLRNAWCQFGGGRGFAEVGVGVVAVHAFVAEALGHARDATSPPAFALRS